MFVSVLSCKAEGVPTPRITWKKEDGKSFVVANPSSHNKNDGGGSKKSQGVGSSGVGSQAFSFWENYGQKCSKVLTKDSSIFLELRFSAGDRYKKSLSHWNARKFGTISVVKWKLDIRCVTWSGGGQAPVVFTSGVVRAFTCPRFDARIWEHSSVSLQTASHHQSLAGSHYTSTVSSVFCRSESPTQF